MKDDIKVVVYYDTHTRKFEVVETSAENVFDALEFRQAVQHRQDLNDFFTEEMKNG